MRQALYFALTVFGGYSCCQAQVSTGELEDGKFRWKPALVQAGVFLGVQHAFPLATEPGTRAELRGPFFRDWAGSLRALRGWGDRDPFIVNYVGHPMMGAVTSYIQIQNDPRGRVAQFSASPEYWRSRLRAMGSAAAHAAQFELGPASEASIGNVGKLPGTMGAVDMVVTPLAGFAWTLAEDALDRHLIPRLEGISKNRGWRVAVRALLNPDRAFANLFRWKVPWHRDYRAGVSARAPGS